MHASEAGAALALQPEDEGEKTALSRLRDIYRRATQYRLPAPYWDEEPGRYCDLNPTGEDALVLRDGMGADEDDEKDSAAVLVEFPKPLLDEPRWVFPRDGEPDIVEGQT